MPHPPERDWMIVAPWWKWDNPHDPNSGRVSRPEFQKYDTGDLVNAFLKNPQLSLKFAEEDLVHSLQPAQPLTVTVSKLRRFSEKVYKPDGTNTRKIFRDTHRRFYLVVCQMHCDGPGFPRVARDKVCEAGFVVRRRTTEPPTPSIPEGRDILQKLTAARQQLERVEAELAGSPERVGTSGLAVLQTARTNSLLRQKTSVQALIGAEESRFHGWITRFGIVPEVQGWFNADDGRDKVGGWQKVDETPDALTGERTFPMYPLIPPKNEPDHSGQFGTIYFGVLPTATGETTLTGKDRFDDQTYYEVRCFVKRHKVPHDAGSPCRCPDRVFWSVPTAPYKIAGHFDLAGTSKRPVTVQLPDLDELAAQAKPTLGVAFAAPKGYPMVGGSLPSPFKIPTTSFQICSFPIPLITIVAKFVFELFLPIVMLVFQLWWMLAFKFCIPPEISLDAALNTHFGVNAALSVDASIEAKVNAAIDAEYPLTGDSDNPTDAINAQLKATFTPIAIANANFDVHQAGLAGNSPTVSADLEWEDEVEFS